MYFALFEVANGIINQAMPGDRILAGKGLGDDGQVVMPAFPGPGVTSVAVRLILDDQRLRLQYGQLPTQVFDGIAQAGNAFLKGLIVTCW